MNEKLKFTFNSEPKAIQSVRFRNAGKFVQTYQPKSNIQWKNWIKIQAEMQLPKDFIMIQDAIIINKLHFIFAPLKSFSKKKMKTLEEGKIIYKDTKPDLADNLAKGIMDALSGTVYRDDSLIVRVKDTAKYYGLEPKIILELERIL